MSTEILHVQRLGQRGEGVVEAPEGPLYLPFTVPGDAVSVQRNGAALQGFDLVVPSPGRVAPVCSYFTVCGGCAVQTLPPEPYADWKRGLVVDALRKAKLGVEVDPLVMAHGEGRRRATFHARLQPTPNVLRAPDLRTGFMRARSHEVIDIARCPILAPGLEGGLPAARRLAHTLQNTGKPLDILVTASDVGLDIDLRGLGPMDDADRRRVSVLAADLDVARLSNHGDVVLERRAPEIGIGAVRLVLPPGAFLQATAAGEAAMAGLLREAVGPARKVADLFCGIGTFALRLAERATVTAVDAEGSGLAALSRASRTTQAVRPVTVQSRDLFRRPLAGDELTTFDAVVFDPPRSGALAQAEALAASAVPTVVAVSCNPVTFARDAAALMAGGYRLDRVVPIDQFHFSPHVEVVGLFSRPKVKARGRRSLFG